MAKSQNTYNNIIIIMNLKIDEIEEEILRVDNDVLRCPSFMRSNAIMRISQTDFHTYKSQVKNELDTDNSTMKSELV